MRVSCVDAPDDLDDDDVDAPDDLPLEGISRSSQSSEWLHLLRSVIAQGRLSAAGVICCCHRGGYMRALEGCGWRSQEGFPSYIALVPGLQVYGSMSSIFSDILSHNKKIPSMLEYTSIDNHMFIGKLQIEN